MARVDSDSSEDDENNTMHTHTHTHTDTQGENAQNKDDDNDDEDDDDDDDDDDDESITSDEEIDLDNLNTKIAEVEELIKNEPLVYKHHADLISMLETSKAANKKLVSAYEKLKELCPLSSQMWRSWINMKKDASEAANSHDLFINATTDCYDIEIYCSWCMDSMSGGDTTAIRETMEKCIKAAGCDPMKGSLVWDTVREYELTLLSLMSTSSEKYPEQAMRIFDLYAKQLSLPILIAKDTLEDFEKFVETIDSAIQVKPLSQKVENTRLAAEEVFNKISEYENNLEDFDQDDENLDEKFKIYSEYLSFIRELQSTMNGQGISFLSLMNYVYDRMTSDCCAPICRTENPPKFDPEAICQEYLDFVKSNLSNEECLVVLNKVIRRCPRSANLWIAKLRHLEEVESSLEELKTALEDGLSIGFNTAADYVSFWFSYLEAIRRYTNFSSKQEVDRLRNTFRLAWDSLGQMWGDAADTECYIMLFWMRIEYELTHDFECGKELFEEIIGYGNNRFCSHIWLEFIAMEKIRGNTRARAAYKRALKNCNDPIIQQGWLAFERDFGTLATLIECSKICSEKRKEWEEIQAQSSRNYKYNNHNSGGKNDYREKSWSKNKQDKYSNRKPEKNFDNRKRKHEEMESGKRKKQETKPPPDEDVFAVPKAPAPNLKRKMDNGDDSPSKRLKPESKDSTSACAPPPGYKDNAYDHSENDEEKNNRTAFISNLAFKTDEDTLRKILSEYGEIVDLRVVKSAKSFGCICYCEYSNENAVDIAVSHDRELLNDRPMFISKYCSDKDRKKHFKYSTGIEKNKLFVKSIPFNCCTTEKLTEIFGKYGKLVDIRIVTLKNGEPKGIAYVEYEDAKSASAAIQGTDLMEINGRQLSVSLSAPPPKMTPMQSQPPPIRRHSKTQLFVPAQVSNSATAADAKTNDAQKPAPKMSNSDFRQLLQKPVIQENGK